MSIQFSVYQSKLIYYSRFKSRHGPCFIFAKIQHTAAKLKKQIYKNKSAITLDIIKDTLKAYFGNVIRCFTL